MIPHIIVSHPTPIESINISLPFTLLKLFLVLSVSDEWFKLFYL